MTNRPTPDPNRPTISTGEAARLLECSRETVKNRIRRGAFGDDAGRSPDGRWWIYQDRLVPDEVRQLQQENAALRRRVAELVDHQALADAQRREDRSEIATTLAILGATRQAMDAYKSASESALQTMHEYRTAAEQWMAVADMHLDVMARKNMPNHPGELDDLGR